MDTAQKFVTHAQAKTQLDKKVNLHTAVVDLANATITANVAADTDYFYGELTSLSLDFKAEGANNRESTTSIMFTSGATATNLVVDGDYIAEDFAPSANSVVEVNAKWDMHSSKWVLLFCETAIATA